MNSHTQRCEARPAAAAKSESTHFSSLAQGPRSNDAIARRIRFLQRQNRELKLKVERLSQLAYIDSLTGLANRRYLEMALESEIRRAARTLTPLTLVLCDVDHFKRYNDTYGHHCGDGVLIEVAETICRQCRRAGDVAARYGGEEFALLLPGAGSEESVAVSERLRQSVAALPGPRTRRRELHVTISLGVTTFASAKPCSTKEIARAADVALYRAKKAGRNCTEYEPLEVRGPAPDEIRGGTRTPSAVRDASPSQCPSRGADLPEELDEAGVPDILNFDLQRIVSPEAKR